MQTFRLKRLVQTLDEARGTGTSVITLIVPARYGPVSRVVKMLIDEESSARCIKSRVNRQSVLVALTSARERLKRYQTIPPNGLFVFCGLVAGADGKERRLVYDLEPPQPVTKFAYHCSNCLL